MIDNKQQKLW